MTVPDRNGTSAVVRPRRNSVTGSRPAGLSQVRLDGGFWSQRVASVAEKTIPKIDRMNEASGRYDNFRIVAGQREGSFQGLYFNDSDVYKWLECAAWSLAHFPDADLESRMDEVTALLASAQAPDGYLDTFYQAQDIGQRWTNFRHHELYCAGHLIQAGIAWHRSRGKRRLLDIAIRFADHICDEFSADGNTGVDTHPEIEMALVELYRETGARKYLEQAAYFVDARGLREIDVIEGPAFDQEYHQNRVPFRDLERMEGHAVRMLYLASGAADVAAETGNDDLPEVLERLWGNMAGGHLYVTGGVGSRRETEGFGREYVLPNREAYAETCAAVASIMWNWRMLLMETDRRYADLLELTLYNAMLAGVSLDGERFFYVNPLASDGTHRRQDWFECACCPSNLARTLASLPGYFYTTSDDAFFVHLYDDNTAALTLGNGTPVALSVVTDYPWEGRIEIGIESEGTFGACLRIPAWTANGWRATVNGAAVASRELQRGYLRIDRTWARGDRISLDLDLGVRRLEADARVQENVGRLALMRGPLVYCAEGTDNGGADTENLQLCASSAVTERPQPDLDGAIAIETDGQHLRRDDAWNGSLYREQETERPSKDIRHERITSIPYFAWANREPCSMTVWMHAGDER